MSQPLKLGLHFLAALIGPTITNIERELILKHKVLGFTFFARNIVDKKQLTELNRELQSLAQQKNYTLILAIDQEGGRVARLKAPEFTEIPPMRFFGKEYARTKDLTALQKAITTLCMEMKACGFNLNYAPLVDVDLNPQSPIIGDRSFSKDAQVVTTLADEVVKIHQKHKILTCLKHFPGHGNTTTDSHLELPTDNRTLDELKKCDLVPYYKLLTANCQLAIMTAHVMFPNISPAWPATLSALFIHEILRKKMKYKGVVLSDDLLMKAITDNYPLVASVKRFFSIGGDVALICNEPDKTITVMDKLSAELTNKTGTEESKLLLSRLKASQKRIRKWIADLS